jgi:hypothetical protein
MNLTQLEERRNELIEHIKEVRLQHDNMIKLKRNERIAIMTDIRQMLEDKKQIISELMEQKKGLTKLIQQKRRKVQPAQEDKVYINKRIKSRLLKEEEAQIAQNAYEDNIKKLSKLHSEISRIEGVKGKEKELLLKEKEYERLRDEQERLKKAAMVLYREVSKLEYKMPNKERIAAEKREKELIKFYAARKAARKEEGLDSESESESESDSDY